MGDVELPQQKYDFVSIRQLESMTVDQNTSVDILAVVVDVGTPSSITIKKSGAEVAKRDIQLEDESTAVITCTLWARDAQEFETKGGEIGAVVAIKGARLSDFNSRSLSVGQNSAMQVNPDTPEAHRLSGWYDSTGKDMASTTISNKTGGGGGGSDRRILLHQIKDEGLGAPKPAAPAKADYFLAKGMVVYTRKSDNTLYKACAKVDCNKKVVSLDNERYSCEKCNVTSSDFKYRIMLSVSVADATAQMWVTCFQESAEKILGMSAQELGQLKDQNVERYETAINQATFTQFMWKCRAKTEVYNEEERVKVTCVDVNPVDPLQEAKYLVCRLLLRMFKTKGLYYMYVYVCVCVRA